jgi:phage terminase small subunit
MATGLTLRQGRLVDALLDPTVKTQQEAARRAGYGAITSETTRALKNAKVKQELALRAAHLGDRAAQNASRVLDLHSRILSDLEADHSDVVTAVQASGLVARTAGEYRDKFGDTDLAQAISTKERLKGKLMLLRAMHRGAARGGRVLSLLEAKIDSLRLMIEVLSR